METGRGILWLGLYRDGLCTLLEYQGRRHGGMLNLWRLVFWRWLKRRPKELASPAACRRFNGRFCRRHAPSAYPALRQQMDWPNARGAASCEWSPLWIPTHAEYLGAQRYQLVDSYVNGLLTRPLSLRASVVPVELTACKRAVLRLQRAKRSGYVNVKC